MVEDGTIDHFSKKEGNRLRRELAKLQRNLDGLRHLERVPDLIYVIDPDIEANAVHEANIMKIPVIAIVDTNCDPDPIDFPIPGNDDAIKATRLITSRIADAVLEGREGRQEMVEAAAEQVEGETATGEAEEGEAIPVAAEVSADQVAEEVSEEPPAEPVASETVAEEPKPVVEEKEEAEEGTENDRDKE